MEKFSIFVYVCGVVFFVKLFFTHENTKIIGGGEVSVFFGNGELLD